MRLLEQILAAVDLGPQSDDVLTTASALAKKFGSKVALLHVLPPLSAQPCLAAGGGGHSPKPSLLEKNVSPVTSVLVADRLP